MIKKAFTIDKNEAVSSYVSAMLEHINCCDRLNVCDDLLDVAFDLSELSNNINSLMSKDYQKRVATFKRLFSEGYIGTFMDEKTFREMDDFVHEYREQHGTICEFIVIIEDSDNNDFLVIKSDNITF